MGRNSGGVRGSGGGGSLARSLDAREKAIRGNNYETLIVLDGKGNVIFSKKGGEHSVSYAGEGHKTTNAIVTHNHPGGASFSSHDVAGMVFYNQKEMRATGKEYTFVLTRPEKGWGVSWKKAESRFKKSINSARRAYRLQMTNNAPENRKLWIKLTHKYNAKAAKDLGWNYTAIKNS